MSRLGSLYTRMDNKGVAPTKLAVLTPYVTSYWTKINGRWFKITKQQASLKDVSIVTQIEQGVAATGFIQRK